MVCRISLSKLMFTVSAEGNSHSLASQNIASHSPSDYPYQMRMDRGARLSQMRKGLFVWKLLVRIDERTKDFRFWPRHRAANASPFLKFLKDRSDPPSLDYLLHPPPHPRACRNLSPHESVRKRRRFWRKNRRLSRTKSKQETHKTVVAWAKDDAPPWRHGEVSLEWHWARAGPMHPAPITPCDNVPRKWSAIESVN